MIEQSRHCARENGEGRARSEARAEPGWEPGEHGDKAWRGPRRFRSANFRLGTPACGTTDMILCLGERGSNDRALLRKPG